MIHVLVHENRSRSRLSLLLRELGQTAGFHRDIESLLLSFREDEKKSDPVLVDLRARTSYGETCFSRLKNELEERILIGFEEFDPDSADQGNERPEGLQHHLLLPPQAERAKLRLRTVLSECRRSQNRSANTGRTPVRKGFRRAFNPSAGGRSFPRKSPPPRSEAPEKPLRYLMTQSPASREFGNRLLESLSFETMLVLTGEAGCEFVLAAREMQYQLYGDDESLANIPSDEIEIDLLTRLEKQAKDSGRPRLCFIERCEDISVDAAEDLRLFIQNIENIRDPHLRIIVGREENCAFLHPEAGEIFAHLLDKRQWLRVPPLSERLEDIRPIATGFLSSLSFAHPFLNVKEIDTEAFEYLEENRHEFSYRSLVQILRNAVALGQNRILTADGIQDFLTRDLTAEHLLESSADDAYFPREETEPCLMIS